MIFRSYDKIEEDFKRYNLSTEDNRLLNKIDWVVTEKIHGANFSVITNGNFIKYAKRKEVLEEGDDFFGYKQMLLEKELSFMDLYENIKKTFPDLIQISIYGELFGGGYPSSEIKVNPGVSLIQTGIYYSPNVEFSIFDILLFLPEDNKEFLDYSSLLRLCKEHGILCCEALYIGKLAGALNFNFEFESTIPKVLKLPKLDIPNKAEGIVIKPIENILVSTPRGFVRPVLKRKIEEFSEDRYSQSFNDSDIRQRILSLVNTNRLNNAISKIGTIRKGDKEKINKVIQYIMDDIHEELTNIERTVNKKLNANQKSVLLAEVRNAIDQLVFHFRS